MNFVQRISMVLLIIFAILFTETYVVHAEEKNVQQTYNERMGLYKKFEAVTQIPWYYLAAVDQYERNVRRIRRDIPDDEGIIGVYINSDMWTGPLNPNKADQDLYSIQLFGGIGMDGDGDGLADQQNGEDVLYTFTQHFLANGTDHESIKIALWDYYKRDISVDVILSHAKLYQTYGKLDLTQHAFPVSLNSNYSYRSTWGYARSWGGRRSHEGTDIFANYGTPVRSTCYGVVEIKGWNRLGGWRIGIRDISNTYHYYAHLNGFADNIKVGQVVEPGQVIGSVGSTGYGPPGTAGKFPPHLHYGMYKDNGNIEWSFDPYPHLKAWERQERNK
ncbi:M23 family metallopeptidase [Cytobacillus sp. IB215316]|uniref:M23 family metallopeptidase n=1 Tax=Cytobacillus sp. IB215316 TaxID=3097354 RepID=UPI002A174EC8|nr:M23 family metallopeptidase [Cytobacillus sp. IB215316]MDX8360855.1 M23 family metallopeptidase [Cytobacillus sp. IB215316]